VSAPAHPAATGRGGPGDVVALDGVAVTFPRRPKPVLKGITLHVAPGEHVIVLGASGSGKSTVLQVITGVVPHTVSATLSGSVGVGGTTTEHTPVVERSRHLGVLAQDPGASVCLPQVEQELVLPLENHAVDPASIGPRIAAALDATGAAALRDRATATLSGGESQRVALAAAMVAEPKVLLLDEPTSMLDPAGIISVRAALAGAVKRYDPAVVLVEHRLDEWAGSDGLAGLPARALALTEPGELLALTGAEGGLGAPANTALLEALAAGAPRDWGFYGRAAMAPDGSEPTTERDVRAAIAAEHNGAPPVLAARALAVGRVAGRRRRRWGVRRDEPPPVPVLTGIDLAVRPGEVVALLGANGIGKTTLLLTLARLLEPLAGEVNGPRPGLVFQNAEHQFVAHTVWQEIGHGLPAAVAAKVVPERLRRHRLEHLAEQNPFRLSGGEKRRVSLAAMLAHERPVLLVDEPTLGLDRRDTIATVATLREAADVGAAVVLASHDLRTVATLADRVVLLGDGEVVADGPTARVLRDRAAVSRAGLAVPPLVAWLLEHVPGAAGHVLRELDAAVSRSHYRQAQADCP
jgi:energy-coupling factor transport system ATP-binding protein